MSDYQENPNLDSVVIVCEHVAAGVPILLARRDESIQAEGSGWQFTCRSVPEENPDKAQVWLLREALEQEPSLFDYMFLASGAEVVRQSVTAPWEIKRRQS